MSTNSKAFIFGDLYIKVIRSFFSFLEHLFSPLKSVNLATSFFDGSNIILFITEDCHTTTPFIFSTARFNRFPPVLAEAVEV